MSPTCAPRTATGTEPGNATIGDAGAADAGTRAVGRSELVAQLAEAYFVDVPAGPMTKPGGRGPRDDRRAAGARA